MGNLIDKELKRESEKKERKKVINAIGSKDKVMTVKLSSQLHAEFSKINKAYGLTNNSCVNMLIAEYVQSKKAILED